VILLQVIVILVTVIVVTVELTIPALALLGSRLVLG
jgi:hypothetical protein